MFVKTFKGYEDKTADLDAAVNEWVVKHAGSIEVLTVQTELSHEPEARSRSGDLIYTVLYRSKTNSPLD